MSDKVELRLDWCSYEAAKFAVEHWHYSQTMPSSSVKIGAWEDGQFIGAVCFGIGAGNITRGEKYGLAKTNDIAELMRVALKEHKTPTSKIITIACKMVKKQSPNLRMLISFADELGQGHHGGIYQAAGWVYAGAFEGDGGFIINGQHWHSRSVGSRGWQQSVKWLRENVDPNCTKAATKKHRYLFPLDDAMRKQIEPLRKPYPKRERGEIDNAPQSNAETEGASPIRSLLQEVTE